MVSVDEMMRMLQQGIQTAVQTAIAETMNAQGAAAAAAAVPVERAQKRMDERLFRRIKRFDGSKNVEWKEWGFQFRVAAKASNPDAVRILECVENQTDEVSAEQIVEQFGESEYVEKMSNELFDMLCMLVEGEPLMSIQGIKDGNGFRAWQRLVMKYNPVTPARALMCMIEAVTPPKAKHLRDLPSLMENGSCAFTSWRGSTRKLCRPK